ncbi:hypothetical protein M427DRAFT_430958 [Gonapodya prolifera JEL478]|uniref:Dynactin subunit 6 n=1 Tax=Gonapodya prolifera (strain JEL478) TaxID=1344416 RepID=A0A139ATL5_GONPJ|nr:hypothetical protein M427DRAFT_430958 [Gonapodya prolifera JEL478]|eukprot:KXS19835.1 hypothetical protein M427DRAFT_430958 [Gonapodya prolifera JEL478]
MPWPLTVLPKFCRLIQSMAGQLVPVSTSKSSALVFSPPQSHPSPPVTGDVVLGDGNIVHPLVTFIAHPDARIVIGEDNIFEEGTRVECWSGALTIGDGNLIEVGSAIYSSIGSRCHLEPKSCLLPDSRLEDRCIITAGTKVGGIVEEGTVCAGGTRYRLGGKSHAHDPEVHRRHLAYLSDILPRFHRIT